MRRTVEAINDFLRPWLRRAFAVFVAWPICLVVLGMNIRHRNRLPLKGPAIVTPNHNSHLDTAAMLTIFPISVIPKCGRWRRPTTFSSRG